MHALTVGGEPKVQTVRKLLISRAFFDLVFFFQISKSDWLR